MWNGLPSTLPLKTTDCRSLIGNSGLVISVGFEKVGASMSSRSLSGATGSLSRPAASSWAWVGCGIVAGAELADEESPPHPSASAAMNPIPKTDVLLRNRIRRPQCRVVMRGR